MTDEEFDVYVEQIIVAAKGPTPNESVGNLLDEFKEKAYLSGRHMLIDGVRRVLDGYDDRKARPNV